VHGKHGLLKIVDEYLAHLHKTLAFVEGFADFSCHFGVAFNARVSLFGAHAAMGFQHH
jgi:hypothetical protein